IAGSGGNSGPGQQDPAVGSAAGGAIFNFSTVTVTSSRFSYNQAVGGNNATATGTDIVEVGVGSGGAIDNEFGSLATISHSTLDHNKAIGGNGNSGSGAVVVVGTALGGAADSNFGFALFPNTTTVSNSPLDHNEALGGDNNSGTASVAGLVGVGAGAGLA